MELPIQSAHVLAELTWAANKGDDVPTLLVLARRVSPATSTLSLGVVTELACEQQGGYVKH